MRSVHVNISSGADYESRFVNSREFLNKPWNQADWCVKLERRARNAGG